MYESRATAGNSLGTGLDNIASYLENSSCVLQEYTNIIEHDYAHPALEHLSAYFQAQSISRTWLTTTLALFTVMSILPVLSFMSISVFVVCGSMFIALTFLFMVVAIFETVFAMVLLMVLGVLLLISFVLTTGGVVGYIAFRLIQPQGRSGIIEWVQEMGRYPASVKLADNGDSETSGVFVARSTNDEVKKEDAFLHWGS